MPHMAATGPARSVRRILRLNRVAIRRKVLI
jgi:hypothetical protein